jgi:hypothetical protein
MEERITREWLGNIGHIRQIPNGHWIGVSRFCFTFGLCVGLEDWMGIGYRYCYKSPFDAVKACLLWDGERDAPGPWIKCKGRGRDDHNPLLFDHVRGKRWEPKLPSAIDQAALWPKGL